MTKRLYGKRAVIAGGSRGIGKAIARAYLQEGAEVVLVARSKGELSNAKEGLAPLGRIATYALDVSSKEEVERFSRIVGGENHSLDILVNAAAVLGPLGPVDSVDPKEWLSALVINLYGTFLMTSMLVPLLKKSKRSAIINFVGGGEGPRPNFTSYVAAKGGVARFTETVAQELIEFGITVNAIAPGAVNTKLLDDLLAAGAEKVGPEYEKSLKQKSEGGTPPEKAAALAVWLASDVSAWLTGKILSAVWDEFEEFPEHMEDIMSTDVYTMRRIRPKDRGFG